ncbi:MAG: DNA-processing protein DprA [Candidatus Saccharimonadaceae bacterium]
MKIGKINRQSIGISGFTSVLSTIHLPPTDLYIAGTVPSSRIKSVAIVGSRKPTPYGVEVTQKLAYELAKQGIVIISGLAYGVDAIAHKAALDAGGLTIAVLANGLHRVYPASNIGLAEDIVKKGGAILSEKPIGEEPRNYDFLKRNRLISGLADAIIVTEATEKSGTLSTVGHALDQNKEIFAVPGPITSLLSVGPNKLIQQGAHVVLTAQDVLAIIAPKLQPIQSLLPLGDTPLEAEIIKQLQSGVSSGEALQAVINTPVHEVLQALTMLELKGIIYATGGNHWRLS